MAFHFTGISDVFFSILWIGALKCVFLKTEKIDLMLDFKKENIRKPIREQCCLSSEKLKCTKTSNINIET